MSLSLRFWANKIKITFIKINQTTKNNQPDYDLMQTLISAVQKLVIKGGCGVCGGEGWGCGRLLIEKFNLCFMNKQIQMNEQEIKSHHEDIKVRALSNGFAHSSQIIHDTWRQKLIVEAFHIPNQSKNNESHHFDLDLQSISVYRYTRDKKSYPYILQLHKNIQTGEQLYKTLNIRGEAVKKLTEFLLSQQQLIGVKVDEHKIFTQSEAVIIDDKNKKQIIEKFLQDSKEEVWEELKKDQDLSLRLAKSRVQEEREKDLEEFRVLLMENCTDETGKWQPFFERCKWIFGLSLDFRFLSKMKRELKTGLGNENDEGQSYSDFGLGRLNEYSVLVELKTPDAKIFMASEGDSNTWKISEKLANSLIQILSQKTAWVSNTTNKFPVNPKCILVYGNTNQIDSDIKKLTFEMFRRDSRNIEIITYDELFERAYYIVHQQKIPPDYLQNQDEPVF